jgi:diguanylate cyclase (GGDEF)-like protein
MTASYDIRLVLLSVLVAGVASYSALSLASRVPSATRNAAWFWLIGGALLMGTAIWSMHFIGMLALRLPIALGYDGSWTAASAIAAVMVSLIALATVNRPQLRQREVLYGGVAMGIAISAMHYIGMHAMRMRPAIEYDPLWFALSVLIAIGASFAALLIVFQISRGGGIGLARRAVAALVMALAISGMHYSGMVAARFAAGSYCGAASSLDPDSLGLLIGGITLVVVIVALALSVFDARMEHHTSRLMRQIDRANGELLRLAMHDPLTQLPNRLQFESRLRAAVAGLAGGKARLAVLFVDLDGFKPINDALGHQAGDEVLKAVAVRLQAAVAGRGLSARIGGDEFLLLLESVADAADATHFATVLIDRLALPVMADGQEVEVSASIGVALAPDHDAGPGLIRKADLAMYEAKRGGRNTFRFYSPDYDLAAHNLMEMVRDLRHALERDELTLHYQPKVRAKDGHLTSVEALLRWQRRGHGPVPPAVFIPLAEHNGLIMPIGVWTLRSACRQARRWLDQEGLRIPIAVNLSPLQFLDPSLPGIVAGLVAEYRLEPGMIVAEITEESAIRNHSQAQVTARALVAAGVSVSIDDFGTGYSSLSRMQSMPVSELKLDRSFTEGIEDRAATQAVVEAVARLTRSLSLKLVAEGVETSLQAQLLRDLGCDELQGFHFSAAVLPEAIPGIVARMKAP